MFIIINTIKLYNKKVTELYDLFTFFLFETCVITTIFISIKY